MPQCNIKCSNFRCIGKATGNNGLDGSDGEDGDSIIKSITQDEDNVYFNLSDGTLLTLPKRNSDIIVFEDLAVKAICCKNWDTNLDGELSYEEAAAVKTIGTVFKNNTSIVAFTLIGKYSPNPNDDRRLKAIIDIANTNSEEVRPSVIIEGLRRNKQNIAEEDIIECGDTAFKHLLDL